MAKDKASEIDKIRKAREAWEKDTLAPHEEKHPQWKKEFVTTSSVPVKVLYTPEDVPNADYMKDLGFPSEYPYTRSVQPNAYRGRLWTMRQFAGMGTAEESNARYKFLLANGQTGLSVAFHLPTIFARDSDHPFTEHEISDLH